MDGGMIWPNVPVEATRPAEKLFSYPWLIRIGRDISPIVTTVAPTIPVLAAKRAPTIIIDIDKSYKVTEENILYKCGWSPFLGKTFPSSIFMAM